MAAQVIGGPRNWEVARDKDGHREYKLTLLVASTSVRDGPAVVLTAPGTPRYGSFWRVGNDLDVWAWCRPEATARPLYDRDGCRWWEAQFTFSSKPTERCGERRFEEPTLEPQKVSGSYVTIREEARQDRFGNQLTNSAFQQLRGQQVEFDVHHPTVRVEQNVPLLQLPTVAALMQDGGCVNDAPMWGCPARCVRLKGFSWERKYYGLCSVYYTRTFEFEVNFGTWDRVILDEGTKCLRGRWDTSTAEATWVPDRVGGQPLNPLNPANYQKATDPAGNPTSVLLDGRGSPADVQVQGVWRAVTAAVEVAGGNVQRGQDYVRGETITLTYDGGTILTPLEKYTIRVKVTAVTSQGGVEQAVLADGGGFSVPPSAVQQHATSDGHGSGARFRLTFRQGGGSRTRIGVIGVQKYPQANLFVLGVPATLGPTG